MLDWDSAFINANVNENVFIFIKSILNILSNFIPSKNLIADDKDPPLPPPPSPLPLSLLIKKSVLIKATEIVKNNVILEDIETSIKPVNDLYDTTCMTHDLLQILISFTLS